MTVGPTRSTHRTNPAGRVFGQQKLRDIRDVYAHFGVTCIIDEVYEHFVFDGRRRHQPVEDR